MLPPWCTLYLVLLLHGVWYIALCVGGSVQLPDVCDAKTSSWGKSRKAKKSRRTSELKVLLGIVYTVLLQEIYLMIEWMIGVKLHYALMQKILHWSCDHVQNGKGCVRRMKRKSEVKGEARNARERVFVPKASGRPKQESAEMVLCDIQVKPNNTSPWRSHMSPKQDLRYDKLLKLNSSIMDCDGALTKNGQEKQLKCISVSIMKLSKEFMETEQKIKTKMKTGLSILLLKCKSSLTYLFFSIILMHV